MPIDVKSLSPADALDVAILMEDEARERYEWFARIVGGRYAGDAADMFRMMATYEKKHGLELSQRRQASFPNVPRRITSDMLDDVEAPDRGKPRVFMSARDALAVALSSEEKAYDFFSGSLPHIKEPAVAALFEELGREELRHRDLVKAFMEKLPTGPDVEEDEADEPGSDPG
jgi:rubrerythrin